MLTLYLCSYCSSARHPYYWQLVHTILLLLHSSSIRSPSKSLSSPLNIPFLNGHVVRTLRLSTRHPLHRCPHFILTYPLHFLIHYSPTSSNLFSLIFFNHQPLKYPFRLFSMLSSLVSRFACLYLSPLIAERPSQLGSAAHPMRTCHFLHLKCSASHVTRHTHFPSPLPPRAVFATSLSSLRRIYLYSSLHYSSLTLPLLHQFRCSVM